MTKVLVKVLFMNRTKLILWILLVAVFEIAVGAFIISNACPHCIWKNWF